ncbi:MAG: division/cell wall cluster transcriptional repressor MraZ [Bacteroidota bacterium]
MISLIGEYHCKLDAKGRFLMPAGLRKLLPMDQQTNFVVNRGMDNCLILWPLSVWNEESAKVMGLNTYKEKNRRFRRFFFQGARQIALDGSGRVLLTNMLTEYAKLDKEIVLVAQGDRVEIWGGEVYNSMLTEPDFDIGDLSEEVMGEFKDFDPEE